MSTSQQDRPSTPEEDIKELFSRVAKLNDAVSALLAPAWGSEVGIIPSDHPLYVGEQTAATEATDLHEQVRAAIEDEVYEYRERTMFWPETGGVTEEIARLAARGAMKIRDRDKQVLADEITRLSAVTGQLRALATRWQATVRPGEQHPAAAAILNIIDGNGPSVRECAAADHAHWADKYAGEGP